MKSVVRRVQKKLYGTPGVGYALEFVVGLATLPKKLRAQEERFLRVDETLIHTARDLGATRSQVDSASRSLQTVSETVQRVSQTVEKVAPRPELAEVARHLPTLLNYITSFANTSRELTRRMDALSRDLDGRSSDLAKLSSETWAMGDRLNRQLEELWDRVEFVRVETLFEMNYGRRATRGAEKNPEAITPKVVNQEKVQQMGKDLRLNLGSGHLPIEGYVNVDRRELPGVDVVADVTNVPFPAAAAREVFSSHLVEHFPQEQLRRVVLPYWYQLLDSGGTLRAVLPDWETMIREYASGRYPFADLREVTFGGQDYDGDFHFNMFSKESLTTLLQEAGFQEVSFPVTGRVNGKCFEMEVVARK